MRASRTPRNVSRLVNVPRRCCSTIPTFRDIELATHNDGKRATLTLNRPAALNALTARSMRELVAAANFLDSLPDCRAVVVRGAGRAFCAGFDLSTGAEHEHQLPGEAGLGDLGHEMATAFERMAPVAVAALHGAVVGGGVVLAAACDLRVCTEDVRFIVPEVELGVPLAWGGVPRLMRELGPSLTKELVMTCRPMDAAEARAAGFVNQVLATTIADVRSETTAARVAGAADALAATLAARPRHALLMTKRGVNAAAARAARGLETD